MSLEGPDACQHARELSEEHLGCWCTVLKKWTSCGGICELCERKDKEEE